MTDTKEGASSPAAKQALEELQKEGHVIAKDGFAPEFSAGDGLVHDKPAEEKVIEETAEAKATREASEKKVTEDANIAKGLNADGTPKDEKKPERDISLIPAYKFKIEESKREKAEAALAEANNKIEELSKLKGELSKTDEEDLDKAIEIFAEEHGTDPKFAKGLKDLILKGQKLPADVQEKLKEIDNLKQFKETQTQTEKIAQAVKVYESDFDKEVLPLIKAENPEVSTDVILKIKESMKSVAFSEGYNTLPLKEIFHAKRATFEIPAPKEGKKTTEGDRSGVVRADTEVDFDNMTEEQFKNLSDADTEKYLAHKKSKGGGSGWKK